MRHAVFGQKLSRDINARKALLNNLANALILNGKITTTQAKAKFARSYIEKLVTATKSSDLSSRRKIASSLVPNAFEKLISQIGPGFFTRPGGYTRIIKLEQRNGDAAPMARLEFVQMEKVQPITKKTAVPSQSRARNDQPKSAKNQRKSALNKK